jgi:hypothetical protein
MNIESIFDQVKVELLEKTKDLYNDIEDTLESNDKIDRDCNSFVTKCENGKDNRINYIDDDGFYCDYGWHWYHHCKTPKRDVWKLIYFDGLDCNDCKFGDHDHNICVQCSKQYQYCNQRIRVHPDEIHQREQKNPNYVFIDDLMENIVIGAIVSKLIITFYKTTVKPFVNYYFIV